MRTVEPVDPHIVPLTTQIPRIGSHSPRSWYTQSLRRFTQTKRRTHSPLRRGAQSSLSTRTIPPRGTPSSRVESDNPAVDAHSPLCRLAQSSLSTHTIHHDDRRRLPVDSDNPPVDSRSLLRRPAQSSLSIRTVRPVDPRSARETRHLAACRHAHRAVSVRESSVFEMRRIASRGSSSAGTVPIVAVDCRCRQGELGESSGIPVRVDGHPGEVAGEAVPVVAVDCRCRQGELGESSGIPVRVAAHPAGPAAGAVPIVSSSRANRAIGLSGSARAPCADP